MEILSGFQYLFMDQVRAICIFSDGECLLAFRSFARRSFSTQLTFWFQRFFDLFVVQNVLQIPAQATAA